MPIAFYLFSFIYSLYLHIYLELCNLLLHSSSFSQYFPMPFPEAERQNKFQGSKPQVQGPYAILVLPSYQG